MISESDIWVGAGMKNRKASIWKYPEKSRDRHKLKEAKGKQEKKVMSECRQE